VRAVLREAVLAAMALKREPMLAGGRRKTEIDGR